MLDLPPVEANHTAVRLQGAGHQLDQRGFARAVVTDQADDFAGARAAKDTPSSACTGPKCLVTSCSSRMGDIHLAGGSRHRIRCHMQPSGGSLNALGGAGRGRWRLFHRLIHSSTFTAVTTGMFCGTSSG